MRANRKKKRCEIPKTPLLPKEILEIVERTEILISGVRGICDYSPCLVRIRTAKGSLEISGTALTLCWAGEKRLLLKGHPEKISFLLK